MDLAKPSFGTDVSKEISDGIKEICKRFPKRFAGSKSESDAAEYLSQKLSECTDDVRIEKFKVHPSAFYSRTIFSITCLLLAYAAYYFSAMLSITLIAVAAVPYILENVLCFRAVEPLFKEEESQNVVAVKRCLGELKKRLVFVAHYDAGREWRLNYKFGGATVIVLHAASMAGVIYLIAINIARWALIGGVGAGIAEGAMLYAGFAGGIFLIPWISDYFFLDKNKVIDGASDGLSGCFVALAALEKLKDDRLENTEICVAFTGSGAVGPRGAQAFLDAHGGEFGDETTFVSLNVLRDKGCLSVSTRDINGLVKNSAEAMELVLSSARAAGVECGTSVARFTCADSGVFSRAGLKSVGVNAARSALPDFYRTRNDSCDALSEECLSEVYAVVLKIIKECEPHPAQ